MANSYESYSDELIMKCLLTKDFSEIGNVFEDDVVTKVKAGAFYQAHLDRVTLPKAVEIGAFAFSECEATINIPWANLKSVGREAFYQCQNAGLPGTLSLPKATALGDGAFAGSESKPNTWLQSASFPLWTEIDDTDIGVFTSAMIGMFAYCTALTSVSLPELTALSRSMFSYASAIQEIHLPKCAQIANQAFAYCTSLKKLKLGGAITSLDSTGASFLTNASSFEALILSGITAVPSLSGSPFNGSRIASKQAYIYVPQNLVATMKLASGWSSYVDQIRAIEDYPDICG